MNLQEYAPTKHTRLLILIITIIFVSITAWLYVSNKAVIQSPPIQLPISPTLTSLPTETQETIQEPQAVVHAMYSPEKYGSTNRLEMKGVGINALFPDNVTLTIQEKNMYVAKVNENDTVTFRLLDHNNEGRRAWFLKEYPFAEKYQIESFEGTGASGYIAYARLPEDSPGGFFFFTNLNSQKMLVINGFNYLGGSSVFFGADIEKFKSFISTVKFIPIQTITLETHSVGNLYRWSDTRKTLWADVALGIKLTSPEWAEFRQATSQYDLNGKIIYSSDWFRTTPDIRAYSDKDDPSIQKRIDILGTYGPYTNLAILSTEYSTKTFQEIVTEKLLPAGFCATEWKTTKASCTNPDYCYTKEEVLKNLIVKKELQLGELTAQLRGMNTAFSEKNDCRAQDTWLIRGTNGQYMTSGVSPDSKDFRWEPL